MYKPNQVCTSPGVNISALRLLYLTGFILIILLGGLSACGHKTETNTKTIPIDTTVVDDDTLEVSDTTRSKQTERAR